MAVGEHPDAILAGALRDFAAELDPHDWHEDYRIMLERAAVAIESAARVRAEALERRANAPAAASSETDVMRGRLRSRAASSGIVGEGPEMVDAFERAVRAEAVAGERQRLLALAEDEMGVGAESWFNLEHDETAPEAIKRFLLATGSVPVATPASPEVNFADEFMPPSAMIGDQEARRLGLMGTRPVATPPHGDHDFAPGVDVDMEREGRQPDPSWCNDCGESVSGPVATPTEPERRHDSQCGAPAACINLICRCWCHFEAASPVPVEPRAEQTRCIAPVDGFRCVHPAGHAGDHERCGDPGGGIGCPVPGCRHDVPAEYPEER